MTDVINPKRASPDQLLPYHKKISAEGKAQMICFISYTYMVLKRRENPFFFTETVPPAEPVFPPQHLHRRRQILPDCHSHKGRRWLTRPKRVPLRYHIFGRLPWQRRFFLRSSVPAHKPPLWSYYPDWLPAHHRR